MGIYTTYEYQLLLLNVHVSTILLLVLGDVRITITGGGGTIVGLSMPSG